MRAHGYFSVLAIAAALAVTGCSTPAPPPVSEKVQEYYDSNKSLAPVTKPAALPVVAFLGDSYTQGAGATTEDARWTSLLAASEGWKEINFGFGGTNYGTKGSLDGGTTYAERVKKVIAARPSIVIVSGGGNDLGADQNAGIAATFNQLRAGLPDAKIIALSPFWKAEPLPAELQSVSAEIKQGVESIGGTYIDIANPLEGRPELLSDDGVHPNDAGYVFIAESVQAKL